MINKLSHLFDLLIQIAKLPVVDLCFKLDMNPDDVMSTYRYYTKPHPKYKIFKNKSLGLALIDLSRFSSSKEYIEKFKSKGEAAFHAKKARSKGYTLCEIDRNDYIDQIHEINTSLDIRQGQAMPESYLNKNNYFEPIKNYKYYGVLNKEGRLMAYCNFGIYGDFAAFSQFIGHRSNDGFMHFMLVEIICRFIDERKIRYLIYDTWFGAQPGLKKFKANAGFEPYRAKYSIQ